MKTIKNPSNLLVIRIFYITFALMKGEKLPFVKVGFEFTAAPHINKFMDSDTIQTNPQYFGWWYSSDKIPATRHLAGELPKRFEWIKERYESDECGCEVATPVIENLSDVTKYFNSFKAFTNKYGFTTNIYYSEEGLGGCHIHLDLSWITDRNVKTLLMVNLGKYFTNNPQLNWAFNDVNDNTNANNLLVPLSNRVGLSYTVAAYGNYDGKDYRGTKYKKFKKDINPYRAFCFDPLNLTLYKRYAIRYSHNYETAEFRIFDMPNTLTRHLLHYDVAMAIYKHCYNLAVQGKVVKSEITTIHQVVAMKQTTAIDKLKKSMKELVIAYKRVAKLEENIATRYEWTTLKKSRFGGYEVSEETCYLL